MKLLILTQKVDRNDSVLGFFHKWIEEFANHYDHIVVICLYKGAYSLPSNVEVYSLGKEEGVSRFTYLYRFYKYIFLYRKDYDQVFVHMNQEYVILGSGFWKLLNKRIYLWRNHAKGDSLTRLAIVISDKVFCTSPQSYTAKFKKTHIMPVGIDINFFKPNLVIKRIPNSILFLGRIDPVKRVVEFIEWVNELKDKNEKFSVTVAGVETQNGLNYNKMVHAKVEEFKLYDKVKFIGPVSQRKALELYQSHETYVNMTLAGSFDKTILEAAACETSVIVSNSDLKILETKSGKDLRNFVVKNHSLDKLMLEILIQIHG